ncbi:hypothetical protein AVR91_0203515 [Amycolatopsis keratiniphila subsp. keratiniphila]|uniref:Uncharacterized protein n=1 Tax=Amycolatopsis keratiniphila subsp. keratiniphila TaxID=227715 RepID=A0A1W2M300_9PSEU|nr:hypothetical protein AVR91_0203515 [Amycolatopsis keratiniphila subsp. keratiniphila]
MHTTIVKTANTDHSGRGTPGPAARVSHQFPHALLIRGIAQVAEETSPVVAEQVRPLDLQRSVSKSRDFR